ncbi:Glutamate [NMDA] receptor subunit 1 [Toxocara canis]|uniref:Glutamate [NMDA] receptor subunit 1 n=1 Tax=Toxocara canis TaxID=6265 RepID=A0A0B2VKC2_TOXCA|nr:Glutamate [NMDA] receptor subunit 1 [Toxocara canis]
MIVMRYGVDFLAAYDVDPPQQCADNALNSDWMNTVGNSFYRHLLSTAVFGDNKIEFNDKGDRINIAYDITNSIDGKLELVGYMSGQHRMELDESRIVWLGGSSKPLEITLPKHLRAVTVADHPFVYVVPTVDSARCTELETVIVEDIVVNGPWFACPKRNNDSTTEMFCCAGYAIDLLANLALPEVNGSVDTGFTFDLHLNESYGAVLLGENGYVLNGMVGELDIDLADLAIGALTINPEREQYIDFSEPWLYHGIKILEKWKPRDSPMESFLQPLKTSLWSALFISVLFVGCAIFLLDLYSPFDRFYRVDRSRIDPNDPFLEPTEDDRLDFGESMWFVWGVLLNSGVSEKTPRSCSARVLGVVWCGFCMIMVASYTANLAAFLVLDQPEKGLTGVTDPRLRNPSANFSFGTVLDTNTYQYFKRHVELSTMYRNMEAHNVRVAAHAIRALINETLDAFIWDSTRLEFEAARNCELRTRGALFGRSAYGIGLQKNSPWTPHITNAILRLTESGKMEELYEKWIASATSKQCVQETHKSPARLGLTNMRDVFILVSGGIGVGIILSMLEVSYGIRKTKRRKRQQLTLRYAQKWRMLASCHYSHAIGSISGLTSPDTISIPQIYQKDRLMVQRYTTNTLRSVCRMQHKLPKTDLNFRTKPVRVFCSRCRVRQRSPHKNDNDWTEND